MDENDSDIQTSDENDSGTSVKLVCPNSPSLSYKIVC